MSFAKRHCTYINKMDDFVQIIQKLMGVLYFNLSYLF
jgi:hypothetical protein